MVLINDVFSLLFMQRILRIPDIFTRVQIAVRNPRSGRSVWGYLSIGVISLLGLSLYRDYRCCEVGTKLKGI